MTSSRTIPIAIVAAGVIIAGAVYLSIPQGASTGLGTGNPALVRPVGASDHILGNPAAPVMIVEYSDFDCEYCKGFHETMHQIIAAEGAQGRVAWVFRQFPLTEIHPNALAHARAAECAASTGGNNLFWQFADALYTNQPVDPTSYGTLASSIGISGSDFASCYATAASTLDERILADRQNALDVGARGTPYSLILVRDKAPIVVDGAYPYDDLKALIDEALVI